MLSEVELMKITGIKHARKLWKPGEKRYILAVLWDDDMITSCVYEGSERQCCHTEANGGEEAYFSFIAHLCSPEVGFREERIEVEKDEGLKLAERGMIA